MGFSEHVLDRPLQVAGSPVRERNGVTRMGGSVGPLPQRTMVTGLAIPIGLRKGNAMGMVRVVASCLAAASLVMAFDVRATQPYEEYSKHIESAQNLTALDDNLMGDNVSLYNGATEFTATDISIPGNNALPVQLRRRFSIELKTGLGASNYGGIGNWDIDVPYINGTWSQGAWPSTRCSVASYPSVPAPLALSDVWHGTSVHFPGGGDRKLLMTPSASNFPKPASGVFYWTTAQRDMVSCIPMQSGLPGEGFLLLTTDGLKYYFDVATTRILEGIQYQQNGITTNAGRTQYYLLASKIEDRFGNTVNFGYNANGYPTSITSSDGRQITLTYSGTRLDSASVNSGAAQRTWHYTYGTTGDNANMLTTVTLPDSHSWQYAYVGSLFPLDEMWDGNTGSNCNLKPPPATAGLTLTITHPSGAQGQFVFGTWRHPRSGIHIDMCSQSVIDGQTFYKLMKPNYFDSMTISSKTITGPGLAARQWSYDFPNFSEPLWGTRGDGQPYPCATCPSEKIVTVHEPDGTKTDYTYGYLYALNEGRLLKTTIYDQNAVVKRVEATTYMSEASASGQGFYTLYGYGLGDDEPSTLNVRPIVSRTITQDGVTFSWSVSTGCTTSSQFCFDNYANPTKVIKSSTIGSGYSRTELTTYFYQTSKWVLGQTASLKCVAPTTALPTGCGSSGTMMSETTYDPVYAVPTQVKAFGKLQQTLGYNFTAGTQDGTLNTVKDGNSHVTTLTNWYRGIPRNIAYADGKSMSASVDDNGWITSVKDENLYTTNYAYDAMGRLKTITYPTGDTPAWNPTSIAYAQVASVQYGIPAGHWTRTESTGNSRKVTYYDAMWRPLVEEQYDNANAPATRSLSVKRYDVSGHLAFQAYPVATLPNGYADTALKGTDTYYDALDRVTSVQQDSELGLLTTGTTYLAGFKTQVKNPRGYKTTTSYLAYDEPTTDWPVNIQAADGVTTEADTDIARDPFGKPLTITRHDPGNTTVETRSYAYNINQELCRTVEPETGATLMGYDNAGNLAWSAAGLPASTACDLEGDTATILARKAARSYDARNRLDTLSFPDGRGDQEWVYWPDGLPKTITTYNGPAGTLPVTNDYNYNHRRLLVGESSDPGASPTLSIGYGYDANGHLSSQVWPDGKTVQFQPNALGQATRVDTGVGNPMAWNASYYPNGALKSFNYGNGIVHTMIQNTRQLPDTSTDAYNGTTFINDSYDYDQNGNVSAITDGATGTSQRGNRTMAYDALDRLMYADSAMFATTGSGHAAYTHDALDNLTRVTMPATASAPARDWYYCYDEHWQLTNLKTGSCAGGSVGGLGYDVQGNVVNKDGNHFDFDYGNRLRGATYNSASLETYSYDAYGRRVLSTAPTGTIRSLYSQGGQLLYQDNTRTGKRINYYYLAGSLVNEVETTVASGAVANRYQHTDALGSPVLVTDGGRVIQGVRTEYEPYGQILAGGVADRPNYTGHVADAQTGMDYMQQRYYDPTIGRFLSVDPVTATSVGGNFNRYWYANDNPYRFIDPDGRCTGSHIENKDGTCASSGGFTTMSGPQGSTKSQNRNVQRANQSSERTWVDRNIRERNWFTGEGSLTDVESLVDSVLPPLLNSPEGALAGGLKFTGAGLLAVRLGIAGEDAVRAAYAIGGREFIYINGRLRLPDGLNRVAGTINEVKNVSYQAYTRQLRDYVDYARANGLQFNLFVRPGAQLSAPLEAAIKSGDITLKTIP